MAGALNLGHADAARAAPSASYAAGAAVDCGHGTGQWEINRVRDAADGSVTVHLVPSEACSGINYLFAVGVGTSSFFIQLRGDGTLTSQNTDAAAVAGGAVQFANTAVSVVERSAYNRQWTIRQVASGTLNASVVHVPGITYLFEANSVSKTYSVAKPCAVAPPTLDMGGYLFDAWLTRPTTARRFLTPTRPTAMATVSVTRATATVTTMTTA